MKKLNAWIRAERGRAAALARAMNVTPPFVLKIASGSRAVPLAHCVAIERATGGEVTRRDLRPDDWHQIWPELAATPPVAPAQGAA